MFEQRRCQRGATPKDKVRAVLRLNAANALDDVRSKALGRPPCETFRTVCSDIFSRRIDAVRHRTARRLWPEARPDIVGATAKQQIKALAMRGEDCISASGSPVGRGPVAVGETVVIGGVLDHAVQRNMFHDLDLSHAVSFHPSLRQPVAGGASGTTLGRYFHSVRLFPSSGPMSKNGRTSTGARQATTALRPHARASSRLATSS